MALAVMAGMAVLVPAPDRTFTESRGLPADVLLQRPGREFAVAGADGRFHLAPERKVERNREYAPSAVRDRAIRWQRPGSSYDRLEARREVRAMLRSERLVGGSGPTGKKGAAGARSATWKSLGPDNLGGRTRAILIDPNDPNVLFAGAIAGGVWKSVDAGETWRPLGDTLSNIAIGAMAMDPSNSQVVYAGTGDAVNRLGRTGSRGAGIMKTSDGGTNWQFLPSTQTPDFEYVSALKISERDPQTIYAGTGNGVWRSSDGGGEWTQILASPSVLGCTDIALRTDKPVDHLLVSCGGFFPNDAGVYLSTDGGTSFEQVVSKVDGVAVGRAGVAIAPSDQDVMYASVSDNDGLALGLLKSTQGGVPGSWEIVNRPGTGPGSPPWLSWCDDPAYQAGQGYFANPIAVDPADPERIFLGSIDMFRSDDGGKTMTVMSYWWLDDALGYASDTDGTQYMHADKHAIVFHPGYDGKSNTTAYFGTDGGIFRTDDATAPLTDPDCNSTGNKVTYQGLNDGYVTSLFYEGAVADSGKIFLGGLQDNGTWLEEEVTKPANPWQAINGGDGAAAAVDPTGEIAYSTSQNGYISKTTDKGVTSALATAGISEDSAFLTPLTMDPNDPNILWTGADSMWRTTDSAETWTKASFDFPSPEKVGTIAVAPGNSNIVYAALEYGGLFKTDSGLQKVPVWAEVGMGALPPDEQVTSIAISPQDNNTVYVTVANFGVGRVWKTTDGGATWANVDGAAPAAIPDSPAHSVAINPLNPSMVYVGTDSGVFESLDAGATWRVANENLATTTVEDLVFPRDSSELYAFTYGRGAYRVDVGTQAPPANDSLETPTGIPTIPYTDKVNTRLATSDPGDPKVNCDPAGSQGGKSVWYRFSPASAGNYTFSTEDSNYDTVLSVYTQDGGALSPLACDDDFYGEGRESKVTFGASAGTTYLIEVTRSGDAEGDGLGGSLNFSLK